MVKLYFGYVTNIDQNSRVCVHIPDLNYTTGYLPCTKSHSKYDKDGSFFDINEEVALLLNNDGIDGLVIGAINTEQSPLPSSDRFKKYYIFTNGTKFEHDRQKGDTTADIKGTLSIKTLKTTHDGDLYITGNIICNGDISDKKSSMQTIRDIYNTHTNPNDGIPPQKM